MLLLTSCGEFQQRGTITERGDNTSVAPGLRLNTLLGSSSGAEFLRAQNERVFHFPQDHLAHEGFQSEWWYLTAVAHDSVGREYGVQFTLFRQALAPEPLGAGPWRTGVAYLGHLAITDVDAASHTHAQRFARGHPRLAGVSKQAPLHAWIEDWHLRDMGQDLAKLDLSLQAADDDIGVDLRIRQNHPIVLQAEQGLSRKGPNAASYYYSLPRLELSGELTVQGERVEVEGLAWLDREWSTSVLPKAVEGWDWFALQLNDGRNVMAFRLRRQDGRRDEFDHGVWLSPNLTNAQPLVMQGDAGVHTLKPSQFRLKPLDFYDDSRGRRWPIAWRLDINAEFENASFTIVAMVEDQVMDTAIVYWEGIVAVHDEQGDDVGRGYMELTGYAGSK